MSFDIAEDDAAYLLKVVEEGNGVVMLGAGASVSSKNSSGQPVPMSSSLAAKFCQAAAIDYNDENLKDVLDAIDGDKLLSTAQKQIVLNQAYKGCKPSAELEKLFSYSWRRLYSWNIDDLVENIRTRKAQAVRIYNGMVDKAVEFEAHDYLHVVYLHGQVTKPEHDYIFTEEEYNYAILGNWHHWYKDWRKITLQLAQSSLDLR